MRHGRLYTDSAGESHFEDVEVELALADFAPPAPPMNVSGARAASGVAFVSAPPGWHGEWHPAPRRQFLFFLAGEIVGQASDGEERHFGPGSALLLEDTVGKGHPSWVVGETDVIFAAVPLLD